mmetsp:Transcript_29520/g.28391  ORF Transcript_29520/g.28391 Transcript_29520/m.28391 type:complete len:209 (-) Transcript_29520:201-827(-)
MPLPRRRRTSRRRMPTLLLLRQRSPHRGVCSTYWTGTTREDSIATSCWLRPRSWSSFGPESPSKITIAITITPWWIASWRSRTRTETGSFRLWSLPTPPRRNPSCGSWTTPWRPPLPLRRRPTPTASPNRKRGRDCLAANLPTNALMRCCGSVSSGRSASAAHQVLSLFSGITRRVAWSSASSTPKSNSSNSKTVVTMTTKKAVCYRY